MLEDPLFAGHLFFLMLLVIAIASEITLRRLRVPYTIGLVVVGLTLGLLLPQMTGGQLLQVAQNETIFFIFIPILVFESALNMDGRLLMRNLLPALLLAIPGLLLSTAIVAALVVWLTPLPLGQAILFGALISATDPVAVIALFKELGAPKKLTILVEGESLLNDATAIVLFELILLQIEQAHSGGGGFGLVTIAGGLQSFVVVFFGGSLVGLLLGLLTIRLIPLERGNPMVQVATSVAVALLAFVVAEDFLHVSGVMATVGAGLVVGWYRDVKYSREAQTSIHQFWEFAAFLANSLIFLFLGLTQAGFVRELFAEGVLGTMGGTTDLLTYAAVAIVAVLVARGITIAVLFPLLLNRLPKASSIDWRYQLTIYWGGLRGAVGVALALSLNPDLVDRRTIVGLTLAVVFFTAIVSGTTIGKLIRRLRLNIPDLVDRVLHAQATLAVKQSALAQVSSTVQPGHLSQRLRRSLQQQYEREVSEQKDILSRLRADPLYKQQGIDAQMLWLQALNLEQAAYQETYERGGISEAVMQELKLTIDLKRDAVRRGQIPPPSEIVVPPDQRLLEAIAVLIEKIAPKSKLAETQRLEVLETRYECEAAIADVASYVAGEVHQHQELAETSDAVVSRCRNIYREMSIAAMNSLDRIAKDYPEYAILLQRRMAQASALEAELMALKTLQEEGDIPPMVAQEVRHDVETERYKLVHQPLTNLDRRPAEVLRHLSGLKEVPNEEFERLVERLTCHRVLAGETIFESGQESTRLYFIVEGTVALFDGECAPQRPGARDASLHVGEFFGEEVLTGASLTCQSAIAVTDCQLYEFPRALLLKEFPQVWEALQLIQMEPDRVATKQATLLWP
ncbi:MAG: cation:proton antiporter [Cyanobacteria bacterium P01_E01_bin.34]